MRKLGKSDIRRRAEDMANLLELNELMQRYPRQLSGGQRQRVAMGRALVREPTIFLLDEPLSNLDAKLRVQLRSEIADLQRRLGTTMIYVTHDQMEAMTLGHRIAVLRNGRLQQVGTPDAIYHKPANAFVAGFLGTPPMNLFPARINIHADKSARVTIGRRSLPVSAASLEELATEKWNGKTVTAGIRPEALRQCENCESLLEGRLELAEFLGHETLLHCSVAQADDQPAPRLIARVTGLSTVSKGADVHFQFDPQDLLIFPEPYSNL